MQWYSSKILRQSMTESRGVAEWLRHSALNLPGSTPVGSNPVVGAINDNPTANSAVHPSKVHK